MREEHCNARGILHGGVIAALADNAMGMSYVVAARNAGLEIITPLTVTLSIDYAATARIGQWLQIEPRVIKAGRTTGFVDALVKGDNATAARASATFRAM